MISFIRTLLCIQALLWLASGSIQAQTVTINGYAKSYAGKTLEVVTYKDLISMSTEVLAKAPITDSGTFEVQIPVRKVEFATLRVGKQKASIYLVPGQHYKVSYPPRDTQAAPNPNTEQVSELLFAVKDTTELNAQIAAFNAEIDAFWAKHYPLFVAHRGQPKLDSLKKVIKARYANHPNAYLKSYAEFSIAANEQALTRNRKYLATEYFFKRAPMYDNYEYMSFFNLFFKQHLYKLALNNTAVYFPIINEQGNYLALNQAAKKDWYLKNDTLRELVLIKGLEELYYVNDFNRSKIVGMLEQLINETYVPEHKSIAQYVLNSFSKLQQGEIAPNFTLKDRFGKEVSLSDFKDKFIYLDFWATWCTPCLQELKLMEPLVKKYGDKIVFISVSLDEKPEQMQQFLAKNPKYNWQFLYAGANGEIKETYEVKSLPTYFFINTYGKFVKSPAQRPSEFAEDLFIQATREKPKSYKVGEK